jgi:hypothetical protein
LEQGISPRRSPGKNPEQGRPTCFPRNNFDVIDDQPEKSQFNRTSEVTVEIELAAVMTAATATVTAAVVANTATTPEKGSPTQHEATATVTAAVVANPTTTDMTATVTTAAVTTAASNNNTNRQWQHSGVGIASVSAVTGAAARC